jgi:hypothetical protein
MVRNSFTGPTPEEWQNLRHGSSQSAQNCSSTTLMAFL